MAGTPVVRALLICDHVWRDPRAGKWHVCGIFDRVGAPEAPVRQGPTGVYVNLTGLNGSYQLAIEIVRAEDESVLGGLQQKAPMLVTDPLAPYEVGFNLPGFVLPKFGKHLFRLRANGQLLQDIVFSVDRIRPHEPAADHNQGPEQ